MKFISSKPLIFIIASIFASGCTSAPSPTIPVNEQSSLLEARAAFESCIPPSGDGGRSKLAAHYIANTVLFGIIIGPGATYANQDNIREKGDARTVKTCLEEKGFESRELTLEERIAIDRAGAQRTALLEHLVRGGTLETFQLSQSF